MKKFYLSIHGQSSQHQLQIAKIHTYLKLIENTTALTFIEIDKLLMLFSLLGPQIVPLLNNMRAITYKAEHKLYRTDTCTSGGSWLCHEAKIISKEGRFIIATVYALCSAYQCGGQ